MFYLNSDMVIFNLTAFVAIRIEIRESDRDEEEFPVCGYTVGEHQKEVIELFETITEASEFVIQIARLLDAYRRPNGGDIAEYRQRCPGVPELIHISGLVQTRRDASRENKQNT